MYQKKRKDEMEIQDLELQAQHDLELLLKGSVEYCDDDSMFVSSCHSDVQEFASELCRKPKEVVCSVVIV